MNLQCLISIIVPVYNVERYLRQCLDSIVNQTYENLEIILVNDGSTDNSGKICDEYALKDNRIKVIHKKNGGLSNARNKGIENVTGRYIMFVDSDDFITLDCCEKLYAMVCKYNCEIVRGNAYKYYPNKKIQYKQIPVFENPISGLEFITLAIAKNCMLMNVQFALYSTEFIKKHNLYFCDGIYHEDVLWTPQAYLYAKTVCSINQYVYYYCEREGSITVGKWKEKQKEDIVFSCKKLYPIFKVLPLKYRSVILDYLCGIYLNAITLSKDKDADRKFSLKTAYSIRNFTKSLLFFVTPIGYFKIHQVFSKLFR